MRTEYSVTVSYMRNRNNLKQVPKNAFGTHLLLHYMK